MGLDARLSNPYTTKPSAKSKKKTDRMDARILAGPHRGSYIIESHVPSKKAMHSRDLTRFRRTLVLNRAGYKNNIHGILKSNQPKHTPFTQMDGQGPKDWQLLHGDVLGYYTIHGSGSTAIASDG